MLVVVEEVEVEEVVEDVEEVVVTFVGLGVLVSMSRLSLLTDTVTSIRYSLVTNGVSSIYYNE